MEKGVSHGLILWSGLWPYLPGELDPLYRLLDLNGQQAKADSALTRPVTRESLVEGA